MPYINLIQEQRHALQVGETRSRVAFFSFVGITVISIFGYGYLLFQSDALTSKQTNLELQLQRLEPTVSQIAKNKIVEQELQPRLASLEEASKLTDKWITIMDSLTVQTPPETWITAMRGTGQDPQTPIALTISGMSSRQELIGEFISRTQNDPALENVQLRFTNEKPVGAGKAIEFEVGADIKDTAAVPAINDVKP
jgi:Tfp pilus assembly protein PilN